MHGSTEKSLRVISLCLMLTMLLGVIFCFPAQASDEIVEEDLTAVYDGEQSDAIDDEQPPVREYADLADTGAGNLFLNKTALTLDLKQEYKLIAFDSATNASVTTMKFTSSNTAVVTVTAQGIVTGVKAGTANITALDTKTNRKAVCKVTVTGTTYQAPAAPTTPKAETLTLNKTSATIYKGAYYQLYASSNATISYSSSNTSVATVTSVGTIRGVGVGSANITVKTSTKSATFRITVVSGSSVHISNTSVSMPAGKTLLLRSGTSGVKWSTSNSTLATVSNGYVLAKKAGYVVISASTGSGTATCLIKISDAAPIRFAYCSPNCATKGGKVCFYAVTDKTRTNVCFRVYKADGSSNLIYAKTKAADGNTYVWSAEGTFSIAGTYKVVAYSMYGGKWLTCSDGTTSAFVVNSSDKTTTVCTHRRASSEVLGLLAEFEGYVGHVYTDSYTGDPTLGYGRVVLTGQQFYNDLTKREAYAYLVHTVNDEGYATGVSNFLVNNNVKFNQQQFDALVCLVYNTGTGVLTGDSEIKSAILNCSDGSGGTSTTYYINGSDVRLRQGASTSTAIIKEMDYGTVLTIRQKTNSSWWKVKLADGSVGYVNTDYISSRSTSGNLDLKYVNKQNLINKVCAYHHAGGQCVYGLLYRRVDEMEMFFYGDYKASYGESNYGIHFTCTRNPSCKI